MSEAEIKQSLRELAESVYELHGLLARVDERTSNAITQLNENQRRSSDRAHRAIEEHERRILQAEQRSEARDEDLNEELVRFSVQFSQRLDNISALVETKARQDIEQRAYVKGAMWAVGAVATVAGGLGGTIIPLVWNKLVGGTP